MNKEKPFNNSNRIRLALGQGPGKHAQAMAGDDANSRKPPELKFRKKPNGTENASGNHRSSFGKRKK